MANCSNNFLVLLLLLAGDVECNPGPYKPGKFQSYKSSFFHY